MAGTITRMSKIKQVLQLHQLGFSNRHIGKQLGLYKQTVNDYVCKLKAHNYDIAELLTLDDPVMEARFMAGNPAYTEDRFLIFKDKIPYFEKELARAHVKRMTIWEEYIGEHPDGYRYSQFCYHLNQMKTARHPSAILEHQPGEKLFIDFAGDTVAYIDRETGEIRQAQVFVACFPYSDYTFVMAVRSQSTDDFLYALCCALRHLGGSPKILVPDNLKAAVIKADKYEPDLNRLMDDFANHYGFVVLPARVRKPKDKASVENQVKIIYTRVYAKLRNETFFSIEDINHAFEIKIREHNQTRMQQKGYSRQEKFLAEEKVLLTPLPTCEFQVKYYTSLTVAHNNCIYLGRDKHYYSVHHSYIGRKVEVIYTRTLVCIYCDGNCIATHSRVIGFGYTTVKDHLCSTHKHYKERSPEYYIKLAKTRSESLSALVSLNFEQQEIPEVIYRRCDGLMSLQRKTDPTIFEKACQYALENNVLSYKSLQRIIENKTYLIQEESFEQKPLPKHENIRGREYYTNNNQTKTTWNKSNQN
jgi:transposase